LKVLVNADGVATEVKGTPQRGCSRPGDANPNSKLTNAQAKLLREYRADEKVGWSHRDLGKLFGISEARSSEIARGLAYRDAGGPLEPMGGYKRYNHSYQYDEAGAAQEAERIRELSAAGHTHREIAARTGRSKTHVGNVLRGKTRY
jgi:hypothetical protein